MANTTPSIYMSLPVPTPTVDPGPQFATDLNSCLTILDSHTHSSGSGQQITPAGISINQNLAFFNNNAISLRSARFQVQNSPISNPSDLDCVYVSGVDLYYNDNNGNQVRLTQNGGVAGTPGSIGGLASPASVNYLSGSQTFVFQSSTATPANLDAGAIVLRNITANSKGITVSPPVGLANNYSLAFPGALPSTGSQIVSSDNSGNLSFISNYGVDNSTIQLSLNSLSIKDRGVTTSKLAQIVASTSSSCGTFTTTSTTYVNVTNLNINVITSGRPVSIQLKDDGIGTNCRFQSTNSGSGITSQANIQILRNGTRIYETQFGYAAVGVTFQTMLIPPSSINVVDLGPLPSSSYTYSVQMHSNDPSNSAQAFNVVLVGYEI